MTTIDKIVIIVSLIVFVFGLKSLLKRFYILYKGVKTKATLVGLEQYKTAHAGDGRTISFFPIIEFYDKDILVKQTLSESMPKYVNNKEISITYLKSNGKYEIINHNNNFFYKITLILTFISTLSLLYFFNKIF